MSSEFLTTRELSERIKYDERYIRECLKDKIFKKGRHYINPFGGRKILFIWEEVKEVMIGLMDVKEQERVFIIPLRKKKKRGANG